MLVKSSSEFEGAEMLFENEYKPRAKRVTKMMQKVPDEELEPPDAEDPHLLEGLGKASATAEPATDAGSDTEPDATPDTVIDRRKDPPAD